MKIGFLVNPIAGMGGSVGLKGTDGAETLARARKLGAKAIALERAGRALSVSGVREAEVKWLAPAGELGASILNRCDIACSEIGDYGPPTGKATKAVVETYIDKGVDLIVFAGGDGTARDVAEIIGLDTPVIGIPCGVKMHSGVFAVTPEAAGRLIADLATARSVQAGYRRVEIMDIDEEALRAGHVNARLYSYVRAPHLKKLVQNAKVTPPLEDEGMLDALGYEVASEMEYRVTYLIGPGTTAKRPMGALELPTALLGVDLIRDGKLLAGDATRSEAIAMAGDGPMAIITGVTGGQGFVFGRGNQQIGPAAIRRCWPDRVIILASAEKLQRLPSPELIVDTGDPDLDAELRGYTRVRTGPRRSVMMRLI